MNGRKELMAIVQPCPGMSYVTTSTMEPSSSVTAATNDFSLRLIVALCVVAVYSAIITLLLAMLGAYTVKHGRRPSKKDDEYVQLITIHLVAL